MRTNKLLIAMAVFALAFGAYAVVADDSASAATDGYTMEADYQVLGDQPYVHLTVSSPIYASPAKVTITGEDFVYNTLALFSNDAEAYVEVPEMEDGLYTVTLDSKATGKISADFRATEAYAVSVRTSEGGTATVEPTTAHAGDTVTVTATPAEDYKVKEISVNGKAITGTTFTMPAADVLVYVEFEPAVVYCDVTFVVSSDFEPETVKAVSGEILQDIPTTPKFIGVQFVGWFCDGADKAFDFATTPVTENLTVYAHYGPVAPSEEQTEKFVAAMSDDCNLVLTAYDGNIIGKGIAKVTVYKMETVRGMNMYVAVGTFDADFESDGVYLVEDVSENVDEIIKDVAGSYAVAAFVTLDNTTEQQTDYATFEIDGQA